MAIAFNNKIRQWSTRLSNGPVWPFFRWWFGELKQLLPAHLQQRLQHAMRRITLALDQDHLKLGIEENHSIGWFETLTLQEDAALQKQRIPSLLETHDVGEAPRFFLLDNEQILRKELTLPVAAEPNLQQVLSFEMDRQTPFRAQEVYYTWKMLSSDKSSGQIRVELFVVLRKSVDPTLDILAAQGLAVSGVDVVKDGQTLGINLLPPDRRARIVNPRVRLNYGLAAVALLLLVVVMTQSLSFRASKLSNLEAAIAEVQDEARRVQRLREQVAETSEAASFLTRRRAETPMAIEVLADVTTILPDDTFLDRLVINADGVLMQGKSRNAQQLIEVVNKSELLESASFRGSTRLEPASGLEIFEINADLSARGVP